MNRLLVIIMTLMLGVSCQQAGGVRELKMAHGLNPQHPVHIGLEYMAEKLAEISGGKMHMSIYESEQMEQRISVSRCCRSVHLHLLGVGDVSSNFVDEYKLFGSIYV